MEDTLSAEPAYLAASGTFEATRVRTLAFSVISVAQVIVAWPVHAH